MAKHSEAVGVELHFPMGHSSSGVPLTLTDDTATAYLVENTGGDDIIKIDTTNSAELITLGFQTKVLRNDTATAAALIIDQDSTGDAALRFDAGAGQFMVGIDNDAGGDGDDGLTIAEGTALGTTNRMVVERNNGPFGFASGSVAWARRARMATASATLSGASTTALWTLTLPENFAIMIHAWAIVSSTTETATYEVHGGAYRYAAGATTLITGTPDQTALGEADAAWDVTIDVNSNDVRVVAVANTGDNPIAAVTIWYQIIPTS